MVRPELGGKGEKEGSGEEKEIKKERSSEGVRKRSPSVAMAQGGGDVLEKARGL